MEGIVEADETNVGARRPRKGDEAKRGRGTKKTLVVALEERGKGGRVHARPVERVDGDTLKGEIRMMVSRDASVMTDEWKSYYGLHAEFASHGVVTHGLGEYVRYQEDGPPIHVNTAECFFSLIKRGHFEVYHQMS